MFYYLNGVLSLPDPATAVIDCGGVGFKLTVSGTTLRKLSGKDGETVKLYTHMDVKEDAMDLFGFYTENELSAFRMLITVSGVGPKAAVSILSVLTPEKLSIAIANSDTKAITAANGVGKKIAERIILELKEKLGKVVSAVDVDERADDGATPLGHSQNNDAADALNALLVLGYTRGEAAAAIRQVGAEGKSLEEIVRASLRLLMRQ